MQDCKGLLDGDILYNCQEGGVAGLETSIIIINRDDINVASITYNPNNKMIMTGFQLNSGKTGFLLQGVKQVNSTAFELVKKETSADKKKHTFNGVILSLSAENKLRLEKMSEGGNYVVVVEKKWKGANDADAFDVLGIDVGLELNVATFNSNEADGNAIFELSSVDGFEEPKFPVNMLLTDYTTTKTAFTNKFVQA